MFAVLSSSFFLDVSDGSFPATRVKRVSDILGVPDETELGSAEEQPNEGYSGQGGK